MRVHYYRFFLVFMLSLVISSATVAQSWTFIKEKEGIKLYTSMEAGESLKSYKGVTEMKAPAEKVFAIIEDINNTDWWDKNLTGMTVILYEKNKRAQYYLVYDLPWPVTDRDLCVDVTVTIDPVSGVRKLTAGPMPGLVPEREDMIRIKDYRQTWTVTPAGNDKAHVVLEGHVDPAGSIPEWVVNMIIVDSPIKAISELKLRVEKKPGS
ncbi:MAG: SRPBCC family protein [Bacteroidota bacterium]|jgi:Polyketide cyclase / dehydrase and lipid transport